MGKINLIINDELDERFRLEVAKRIGMKKGNLTKAIEEALGLWIKNPVVRELEKVAINEG